MKLGAPYTEQQSRRQSSLVTPEAFDVVIGASATTIYTGRDAQSFLIRKIAIVNPTGGGITGVILVGGNQWYSASVGAGAIDLVSEIEGFLIDPSTNITATGQNLRVVGWGLRIQGGDAWAL